MENQTTLSKTIGLHKTAFANTLAIISTLQQQGEDLLKTTLEQSPWLPVSSKNACLYWADFYSKSLENLKSMADQGFAEIEQISSPSPKPEENESQQPITTERMPAPRPAKRSPSVRKKSVSAKKTVVAKTLPGKKTIAQKVPVEKPVPENIPAQKPITQSVAAAKPVAHEKLEVKKSKEVKTATSIPEPSINIKPTADPVRGDKESAQKPLQ